MLLRANRFRGAALLVLLLALPGSAGGHRAAPAIEAGDIEGEVQVPAVPPRRVAERYDLGETVIHPVEQVPAVAYVKGPLPDAKAAPGEAPRLAQHDTSFAPAALAIDVGTSVVFPNRDPFFHNVFSYSPTKRFDLGRYPQGESKTVTFDKAGIVKVYCEVHKHMRAVIVVAENPFHAVVGADGRFTMRGVPAGKHEVEVWTADFGTRSAVVDVPAGGTAHVKLTFS